VFLAPMLVALLAPFPAGGGHAGGADACLKRAQGSGVCVLAQFIHTCECALRGVFTA